MPVMLEIPDGEPWYLSPNVWTVPGDNPEGPEGMPVAGKSCYLWSRVTNNGTTSVSNATVRFYWANPSVGFDRTSANLVGTSYVTLNKGETADVLCLTPWIPAYVNEGHECILAEAFHPSFDPLPPTNAFNVPTDRHVAQRNISVAQASSSMFFSFAFEIHNAERKARKFKMRAYQGDMKLIKPLMRHFGRAFVIPGDEGKVKNLGFINVSCPNEESIKNAKSDIDELLIGPNERIGLTLVGTLKGGAALVHVEQFIDKHIVGGLSVLVLQKSDKKKSKGGK